MAMTVWRAILTSPDDLGTKTFSFERKTLVYLDFYGYFVYFLLLEPYLILKIISTAFARECLQYSYCIRIAFQYSDPYFTPKQFQITASWNF